MMAKTSPSFRPCRGWHRAAAVRTPVRRWRERRSRTRRPCSAGSRRRRPQRHRQRRDRQAGPRWFCRLVTIATLDLMEGVLRLPSKPLPVRRTYPMAGIFFLTPLLGFAGRGAAAAAPLARRRVPVRGRVKRHRDREKACRRERAGVQGFSSRALSARPCPAVGGVPGGG
jgi:hypothetical protein